MSVQFDPTLYLKRKVALRQWMEAVLGESIDATQDLALVLQNGVLICRVMSMVSEGSIPKIHSSTTMQFKMRENIMFFLHACEDIEIPKYKIFTIPDLLENKNFFKVLECMEELALIAEQEKKGIPILKPVVVDIKFSEEEIKQADALLKSIGMHQMKHAPAHDRTQRKSANAGSSRTLLRQSAPLPQVPTANSKPQIKPFAIPASPNAHRRNAPNATAQAPSTSSSVPPISPRGNLSTSLPTVPTSSTAVAQPSTRPTKQLSRRGITSMPAEFTKTNKHTLVYEFELTPAITSKTKGWIKFQALVRGHLTRRFYQKRVRNAAYRHNIAKEILTTERVFVGNLKILVKVFLDPMREAMNAGKLPIKPEQVKGIFSDIEVICNYNSLLLADLEPCLADWSPSQRLGPIFLTVTKFLKVYTQYVKDYNTSLSTLNTLKENNPKFAQFLKDCEASPESTGQVLNSFLILPVQRIPRYSLLLAELVKHTWADHRDYTDLCGALKQVQEVAIYVNEKKREAENISRVLEIQNNFTGKYENLAEPHRRVVKEGLLIVAGDSSSTYRTFYLFNDLLVGTKPVASGLFQKRELQKVKEFVKLANIEFYDTLLDNRVSQPPAPLPTSLDPSSDSSLPLSSPPLPTSPTATSTPIPMSPSTKPSAPPTSSSPTSSSPLDDRLHAPPNPKGVDVTLGFELVDYMNRTVYRFFPKNPDERESWISEIRKLKLDLETKRRLTEQSSLRKAQASALKAKEYLGQQYATLRIKGKHVVPSDFNLSPSSSPDGHSPIDSPATESDNEEGVREFTKMRRNTARTSPGTTRRPPLIPFRSDSSSSPSEEKDKDKEKDKEKEKEDKKEEKKDDKKEEKKDRSLRTSWFGTFKRSKKTTQTAEEIAKHLENTSLNSVT